MPINEMLGLAAAAAAAGMINAIAGGGTLITFPVLLFYGVPPIVANATSTLALVIGTAGSIYGYRTQITAVRDLLRRFIPVSLLGGLLGSILLTKTRESTFATLVPFLVLFATVLFFCQGAFRRFAGTHSAAATAAEQDWRQLPLLGSLVFQFLVSVYGGYFGAGIGILMLASLGLMGLNNIYQMNALKTVLSSLINLVAAVYFLWCELVDWPRALIMTVGALGGYYVGAHYAQRFSQARVRQLITAAGFAISAMLFYRQFLR